MRRDSMPSSTHTAFRSALDPLAARRQLRVSVGVTVVLAAAIGLCASAVSPRSGWIKPAATALSQHGLTVNAWLSGAIAERS